jgi:hypothetical protein
MRALLSRKFIFAILVVILAFTLTLMNKVTSQDFLNLAVMVGGIYVVGNIGSRMTSRE